MSLTNEISNEPNNKGVQKKPISHSKSRKNRKIEWTPYLYLLPAVTLSLLFFIFSIVFTFFISFTKWDGVNDIQFVGFENYIEMFNDPNFLIACLNTVIWVLGGLIIPVLIPLILAIAITKSRFGSAFKNIFYLPNALSPTIAGIIMTVLLSLYGLPQVMGMLGLDSLQTNWLNIPYVNTLIMVASGAWQGIGINLILFIVGLNNIPTEPIEAAKLDGASGLTLYTKLILPLLKPTTLIVLLMSLVNSFKTFDVIWVMTGGGPYRTSETLAVTMYKEAFVNNELGYGSAVAIFLSIITLAISWFFLKDTFKGEE
ncbi:multiple sugar transport system permease protein [Gracilibacillus orientalis]|uniref:Multiple sugar transport system permease protein n=1 Tax=Gracilibacillus orientalis TaxID=334253 RepID=A0A1I4K151_9BACI|nr:sugar ABC transporter permease [Gracilibacillus orientalis]SFL72489.1 multiple sugar transport system permease protein [Gracilibacillus orientalis]